MNGAAFNLLVVIGSSARANSKQQTVIVPAVTSICLEYLTRFFVTSQRVDTFPHHWFLGRPGILLRGWTVLWWLRFGDISQRNFVDNLRDFICRKNPPGVNIRERRRLLVCRVVDLLWGILSIVCYKKPSRHPQTSAVVHA